MSYSQGVRNQAAIRWARTPWRATLLFVTFFAHALIPTGFMPAPGGLMLCSGHAPVTSGAATRGLPQLLSPMSAPGPSVPGDAGGANMGICPFAAAATTMSAPQGVATVVFAHLVSTFIELPPGEVIPRGTVVPTSLPRGPPSIA